MQLVTVWLTMFCKLGIFSCSLIQKEKEEVMRKFKRKCIDVSAQYRAVKDVLSVS